MYGHLLNETNEYPTLAKEMLKLWECVQASFDFITHKQCQRFYHSMPNHNEVVFSMYEMVDKLLV